MPSKPLQAAAYRGRFAPSPTGPLHFGSLIAAVGSYADARCNHGQWLVRMEDLDTPRVAPGAADDILRTLDRLGMQSDGSVMYQSARTDAYRAALELLRTRGGVYPCTCSRREIADSAAAGIDGHVYPGTCRSGPAKDKSPRAWRINTTGALVEFDDAILGHRSQDIERDIGDFVLLRADGLFAYQLAVVVDDAAQGVSHVVRGADLIDSTPRQIFLQRLLGLPTPRYAHLPLVVNKRGEKLSKQTHAPAVDITRPAAQIVSALEFLGMAAPADLARATTREVWSWCVENWSLARVSGPHNARPA